MNTLNKAAKNAGWIIGCRLVQAVLALVINIFTARYLGPSSFGIINYAASIVQFFVPVMKLGITSILVNELVKTPEEEGEILGTTLILTFISSVCCVIGVASFALVANHNEPQTILVCVLYSLLLIFQSTEMLQYWFQAKLKSKYVSLSVLAAYVVVALYKVYLLISGKNVAWFAVSNALDYLLISIILFVLYKAQGGQKLRFSARLAGRLLKNGSHYILSGMMVVIFSQTDRIMLKFMINNDAVGYYSTAVAISGLTSFVFSAIITSFQPIILEAHKEDRVAFEKHMATLYSVILYVCLAQSILMTTFANPLVRVLYGVEYMPSVSALRIVVWYTTFSYFGAVNNIWIVANEKQAYLWIVNCIGAVGNVLLNFALIPLWGINGAALASLLTQFFTNFVLGFILKPLRPNNRLIVKGANPKLLIELIKTVLKRKKKSDEE